MKVMRLAAVGSSEKTSDIMWEDWDWAACLRSKSKNWSLKEARESLYFFLAEADVLNELTTGALVKENSNALVNGDKIIRHMIHHAKQ